MKKAYFLVTNPTQMLNAVEARKQFSAEFEKFVLIIFTDADSFIPSIQKIAGEDWEIIVFKDRFDQYWFKPMTRVFLKKKFLQQISREIKSEDTLFIGNIQHFWCCVLSVRVNAECKKFTLDDGLSMLTFYSRFIEQGNRYWSPPLAKGIRGKLERWICGVPKLDTSKWFFFTNLELNQNDARIIRSEMRYTKGLIDSGVSVFQGVYFIEQPIVELGILNKQDYLKLMNKIALYYQNLNLEFIVVRHRSAHLQLLNEFYRVVEYDLPIEFQLSTQREFPQRLATFFSSAIYNIACLQLSEIECDTWAIAHGECDENVLIHSDLFGWFRSLKNAKLNVLKVSLE